MKITRLRFRIVEMALATFGLLIFDGLIHLAEGKPFMTEYLWGAVLATAFLRGLDVFRAATHQWPEV